MRVLVVEDQDEIREVVVETLREEGFAVDGSEDGEDGLFRALSVDYDVVLLDVLMPEKDGWEVLRELRKQSDVAVLMLTALDSTKDKVVGLNLGADDYLAKPFDLDELVARVKALSRRAGGPKSPEISVGDVVVNTSSQRVWKAGEEVSLTGKEFSMVELFVRHADEVLSRTYLYDHLFDDEDDSMSNLLDVYVYKLRSKLGKSFIETRRGQGYVAVR